MASTRLIIYPAELVSRVVDLGDGKKVVSTDALPSASFGLILDNF